MGWVAQGQAAWGGRQGCARTRHEGPPECRAAACRQEEGFQDARTRRKPLDGAAWPQSLDPKPSKQSSKPPRTWADAKLQAAPRSSGGRPRGVKACSTRSRLAAGPSAWGGSRRQQGLAGLSHILLPPRPAAHGAGAWQAWQRLAHAGLTRLHGPLALQRRQVAAPRARVQCKAHGAGARVLAHAQRRAHHPLEPKESAVWGRGADGGASGEGG